MRSAILLSVIPGRLAVLAIVYAIHHIARPRRKSIGRCACTIQSWLGVDQGSFTTPDHEYPAYLELELTATDSAGLSHTQSVLLDPRTVDLTLVSRPGGLTLGFDASQAKASVARRVIVGSRHSISAAATQPEPGKKSYVFQSCSDGRAPSHDTVAPAANTTYTAVYKRSR